MEPSKKMNPKPSTSSEKSRNTLEERAHDGRLGYLSFSVEIQEARQTLLERIIISFETLVFLLIGIVLAKETLGEVDDIKIETIQKYDEFLAPFQTNDASLEPGIQFSVLFSSLATKLLERSNPTNPQEYFAGLILKDVISATEIFFRQILEAIFRRYPKKLTTKTFTVAEILDNTSEELLTRAAQEYINGLQYETPKNFINKFCDILSIEKSTIDQHFLKYLEAKARRDLGVHNDWICNLTYLRKLREVGIESEYSEGEGIYASIDYLFEVVNSISSMSNDLIKAIKGKHGKGHDSNTKTT